jgi:hypothetical protein
VAEAEVVIVPEPAVVVPAGQVVVVPAPHGMAPQLFKQPVEVATPVVVAVVELVQVEQPLVQEPQVVPA